MTETLDARVEELRNRLTALEERIGHACDAAGRDPSEVTAIVVTKTWPIEDARRLVSLGVHDLGENRDQDARAKAEACSDLDVSWHFIGQLQRNKANSVARYADYVHSVDRVALVNALDTGAQKAGRQLKCFVQVSLDEEPAGIDASAGGVAVGHRGGARPQFVPDVCAAIRASEHLELVGLMAVAPLGEDPFAAFSRLADLHGSVLKDFPEAVLLSAGMSGDLEAAIANGATHVRVGSAVLGEREYVR